MGRFSKLILIGDIRQADIKNSGFEKIYNLFDDKKSNDKGICTFKFGREDIMRNDILAYIIEKFEQLD
jgi:phosphate starvation-inducible protein PhoH